MKTTHILKHLVLAGIALTAVPAMAASVQNDNHFKAIDSTMNAMDYLLQKPNPNEKFESKKFGDHLFISAGGGLDWTRGSESSLGQHDKFGYRLGISMGDWITPVHGWKVGIEAGKHYGVNESQPKFVALEADYLMNLSSLLHGYSADRRFELLGLAGVEVEGVLSDGKRKMAAGVHLGLQPRVYVSPTTYLYLEPRLGAYTDGFDMVDTWHKYDWNASVMLGIGFRMNPISGFRVDNSAFVNERFGDNMFFGANLSGHALFRVWNNIGDRIGATGGLFVGKWFSATSALRLSGNCGVLNSPSTNHHWVAIGDIDYLWNLNSAMQGYNPEGRFETNVVLGFSGAVRNGKGGRKFVPGFHAGLQAIWNLTPYFGLYAEPNIRIMSDDISLTPTSKAMFMPALNLGFIYRMRQPERYDRERSGFEMKDFLASRRYFIDVMGGVLMRNSDWRPNFGMSLSFGHWFTPESAWRLGAEFNYLKYSTNYRSISFSADYLASLGTITDGFDAERPVDLGAFVGLSGGFAHYSNRNNKFVWAPRVGLRATVRLSSALDFILEPRLQMTSIPNWSRHYNPEGHVMAGLSYKFGSNKIDRAERTQLFNEERSHNFISISGGPSLYSESLVNSGSLGHVSWFGDISVGHWFNPVSGARFGFSYDHIDKNFDNTSLEVGTLHLDYQLNFMSLFSGKLQPRFNIVGQAGLGLGFSNRAHGKVSPAFIFGLQASYRVWNNLHVTLNPSISAWLPRLDQDYTNSHSFFAVGRIPLGITYDF